MHYLLKYRKSDNTIFNWLVRTGEKILSNTGVTLTREQQSNQDL